MIRKISLVIAIIMCLNVFPFAVFQPVQAAPMQQTFYPEMDTYIDINGNYPGGTSYGSSTGAAGDGPIMMVGFFEYNYPPYNYYGLSQSATKFDLSSVSGTVVDAKFRIFVASKVEADSDPLFVKGVQPTFR